MEDGLLGQLIQLIQVRSAGSPFPEKWLHPVIAVRPFSTNDKNPGCHPLAVHHITIPYRADSRLEKKSCPFVFSFLSLRRWTVALPFLSIPLAQHNVHNVFSFAMSRGRPLQAFIHLSLPWSCLRYFKSTQARVSWAPARDDWVSARCETALAMRVATGGKEGSRGSMADICAGRGQWTSRGVQVCSGWGRGRHRKRYLRNE